MGIKIGKARKSDSKDIIKLFIKEYSKPPYNERWTKASINKKMKDYYKESKIFILKDKKLVGFVIFHEYMWDRGEQGEIDEIVVDSNFQGRGYGTKLMFFVEDYFKKKGIKILSFMSNPKSKAFKFYNKLGYKEHDFVSLQKILK